MLKIFLIAILFLLFPGYAQRTTEDRLDYGGFMRQNLEINTSPFVYNSILPNAIYHFQIGWIEPLYLAKSKIFKRTYMEPGIDVSLSPFSSSVGTFFYMKLFSWVQFKGGYRRHFYHSTLLSYENKPGKDDWTSESLLKNIAEQGEFAGGDIFHYGSFLSVPLYIANFEVKYMVELMNIDQPGKSFIYDYTTDFLLNPRDKIRTVGGRLILFPTHPMQVSLQNEYTWTKETGLKKNLIQLSLLDVPLSRKNYFFLDLHLGHWLMHPQLSQVEFIERTRLKANFKWGLVILGEKKSPE